LHHKPTCFTIVFCINFRKPIPGCHGVSHLTLGARVLYLAENKIALIFRGKTVLNVLKGDFQMHRHDGEPTMEQRIFRMGLSTETISAYLVCCHFEDVKQPISYREMEVRWNSSPESLRQSLTELEQCNVVERIPGEGDDEVYRLNPTIKWEQP
jgi:hypothetical protein